MEVKIELEFLVSFVSALKRLRDYIKYSPHLLLGIICGLATDYIVVKLLDLTVTLDKLATRFVIPASFDHFHPVLGHVSCHLEPKTSARCFTQRRSSSGYLLVREVDPELIKALRVDGQSLWLRLDLAD